MSAELSSHWSEQEDVVDTELQALRSAPIGIAITSLAGSLQYANDAFWRFFDCDVRACTDGDIRQATRGLLSEDFLVSVAREGGPQQMCVFMGANRVLLCTAQRVMHGAFPIYLCVVVQEISDLAAEYQQRWQTTREVFSNYGVVGVWNWTMRIADPEHVGSNPLVWMSRCDDLFGGGLEPRTLDDFVQRMEPSCRQRVVTEVSRAIQARARYYVDYEFVDRDGSIRRMRSVGSCIDGIYPPAPRLIGVELELRPQQAEESGEDVCRTLLDRIDVPVVWIDRQLRYQYFNPAFAALAERARHGTPRLGQSLLSSAEDPVQRRRLVDAARRAMKGEPCVLEMEVFDERNEVCESIDLHFKLVGRIGGALGVGHDVSPLKRASRYHQYLNAQFRQRLEHRAANIDASNRDLSNRVAAACDGLHGKLQEITALLAAEQADTSQPIRAALTDMKAMIDGLSQLSAVGARSPQWRKIDMNRLLREVLRELRPMTEGRSIEFDVRSLPHVVADRVLVKQVLLNLVSNAIKFTRDRVVARVRIWATLEDGMTVWSVADNGIGFKTDDVEEMFGAFVGRGRKPPGTGLSIAWRAIQQLEGRLWCEGSPGQGATFHFTIGDPQFSGR
jgi:signal transduction histidine kinase